MKKPVAIFNFCQKISAVLMTLALLWLTVSLPYVSAARKNIAAATASAQAQDENQGNPFGNTTEEKTPGNTGTGEEFLHHLHEMEHPSVRQLQHSCTHYSDIYVAFHGELTVPPPKS